MLQMYNQVIQICAVTLSSTNDNHLNAHTEYKAYRNKRTSLGSLPHH